MSKIRILTPVLFFLVIFLIAPSTSLDVLTTSDSLNFEQTLISSGQKYEAGFFIPQGAATGMIYLGIWYYKLTDVKTVVWVANRDSPAHNSSTVVLKYGSVDGGQFVVTDDEMAVWVSKKPSSGVVSPVMQLLDTGNLVVREDNNADDYIWQSFDYPGDTMLPSQKLGWSKKTGLESHLISWKSLTDPGTGNYTFTLMRTGDPDLYVTHGTQMIYRTGPYVGGGLSGIPAMTPVTGMNFSLPNTPDEVYYMFALINPSIRSRVVIGQDGILYRYTWNEESQYWVTFWYHPEVPCDRYEACGRYGVCDSSQLFDCVCPHGFVRRDSAAVNLRDGTQGCVRRTDLECGTDGFWLMKNMKLPMSQEATVDMAKGLEECRQACKMDCNCTAYSNAQKVEGVWKGCVIWRGDLQDMRTFQQGGEDLYIRMALADLSVPSPFGGKLKLVIGASIAAVVLLAAIAAYFGWKAKHKPSQTVDQSALRLGGRHDFSGSTTSSKDLSIHYNGSANLELPLYKLDDIVAATANFSNDNKLGEGGFGCVFKGVLNEVQEVAIKRLSKDSIQGLDEFKNEVNLIAKLQHRNLVRLLGYCVNKDEKLLIYEYLHNRSLDFFLFDKDRCSLLDWKTRFNIICGVARGILYLHHDSVIRIIHRDLKASNILLDDSMNPKISDFGMARIFKGDETDANNTRRVVGTYGYMSPEYAMDGTFSIKSDVFSFGVLVLEIVTGKQNRPFHMSRRQVNLPGYSWKMWEEGKGVELLDPSVGGHSYQLNEVLKCIQVGLLCVQAHPNDRPTMSSVVLLLSSETASLPQPKIPGYYLEGIREDDTFVMSEELQEHSFDVDPR